MASEHIAYRPYTFLVLSLLVTWVFWFAAAATGQGWLEFPNVLLTACGFLTPLALAFFLVQRGYWDGNVTSFVRNCFNPAAIAARWYILLAVLLLVSTAGPLVVASIVFGEPISELAAFSPPSAFLLVGLAAGAIEEPGWRGYAQKALQARHSPLVSSLIIGVFWALWHVPLFLIAGTYQSTIGLFSSGFLFFMASVFVGSIFYGWIYNAVGQLAVVAVVYHGFGNVLHEVFSFSRTDVVIQVVEFIPAALISLAVLLLFWKRMTRIPSGAR